MMKLLDKVALITDASHPCGRAIAQGFGREGADCVVLDARAEKADQLAVELRSSGRAAVGFACDVRSKTQIAAAVERVVAQFGRIDILVNCSSPDADDNFLTVSESDFNRALDHGPKAYFLFCQAVGRVMVRQRAGKIINLASTDARIGSGESICTSAAHSSIDALSRAVGQALGYYGINANALLYGPLSSPTLSAEERGERLRRMPFGRLANPQDVVGAAIFLASDDAKFIAGESLCVDAGYANAAVTEDSFRPAWGRVWHEFTVPEPEK